MNMNKSAATQKMWFHIFFLGRHGTSEFRTTRNNQIWKSQSLTCSNRNGSDYSKQALIPSSAPTCRSPQNIPPGTPAPSSGWSHSPRSPSCWWCASRSLGNPFCHFSRARRTWRWISCLLPRGSRERFWPPAWCRWRGPPGVSWRPRGWWQYPFLGNTFRR